MKFPPRVRRTIAPARGSCCRWPQRQFLARLRSRPPCGSCSRRPRGGQRAVVARRPPVRVGRAATACGCRSTIGCPARDRQVAAPTTACARRPAIAYVTETATQMPRDRLAACAYCRRFFGRALQNELRVICLTAQALLRPHTECNLAVMKFLLHYCHATAQRVAPASITAR